MESTHFFPGEATERPRRCGKPHRGSEKNGSLTLPIHEITFISFPVKIYRPKLGAR